MSNGGLHLNHEEESISLAIRTLRKTALDHEETKKLLTNFDHEKQSQFCSSLSSSLYHIQLDHATTKENMTNSRLSELKGYKQFRIINKKITATWTSVIQFNSQSHFTCTFTKFISFSKVILTFSFLYHPLLPAQILHGEIISRWFFISSVQLQNYQRSIILWWKKKEHKHRQNSPTDTKITNYEVLTRDTNPQQGNNSI